MIGSQEKLQITEKSAADGRKCALICKKQSNLQRLEARANDGLPAAKNSFVFYSEELRKAVESMPKDPGSRFWTILMGHLDIPYGNR